MVDKISDVWDISDDEGDNSNYDKMISSREWERMNENFGNVGYKEGIIEGKDITIQKGFDRGYSTGVVIGKEFGRLRGILNTLLEFYLPLINRSNVDDEDTKNILLLPDKSVLDRIKHLENELACLTVEKIFTKEYFQSTLASKGNPWEAGNTSTPETGLSCNFREDIGSGDCCKGRKSDGSNCCERSACLPSQHLKRVENSAEQILKKYREEVDKILSELGLTI